MPRLKSGLCPTSSKLLEVPGVPPPGETPTPPGTAVGSARPSAATAKANNRLRLIVPPRSNIAACWHFGVARHCYLQGLRLHVRDLRTRSGGSIFFSPPVFRTGGGPGATEKTAY